jgi:hypothetical protein
MSHGFRIGYMAKVTYGPASADARGKVGDVIFERARGGNYVRALRLDAGGAGPHNLLSATHLDTTPATPPTRGSLISGQEAVTKWKELPLGANGKVLGSDGLDAKWVDPPAGGVTSVGLALPTQFDISGSPVIAAGTLTGAWKNQDANKVLAGPASGAAAAPAFRLIQPADIPLLDGARVYHSVDQTIATGGEHALAFDTERYDNGGLHAAGANNSRLTAQKAGVYTICAHIVWDSGTNTARGISIWIHSETYIGQTYLFAPGAGYCGLSVSTLYHLAVGDYVECYVHQNTGGNLKVMAFPARSAEFAMQQLTSN